MSVLSSPAYQYLLHYKLSIPKIPTCRNFTNVCKLPTEKFIKLLEFTLTNCIFCFNKKFYKQLQGAATSSPVSPVIANINMEHFESLAIPSSPSLIK